MYVCTYLHFIYFQSISLSLSLYIYVYTFLFPAPLFLFIYVVTWACYDSELSIPLSKIIIHSNIRALNSNDPLWKRSSKWSILSGHWSGLRNIVGGEGGGRHNLETRQGRSRLKRTGTRCKTRWHVCVPIVRAQGPIATIMWTRPLRDLDCNTLQHTAQHCNKRRHAYNRGRHADMTIKTCRVEHAATCCNTLQHTATKVSRPCQRVFPL